MEHTHFIDKEPDKYEALTQLQKEHIQSMKEEHVYTTVDRFEEAWSLKTNDFRNARELGYRQFILIILMIMGIPSHIGLMFWPSRVTVIDNVRILLI